MDIVAYSKLSVNEQRARIEELNEIVRSSEQFRNAETANRILKIPTGDGMSLVFCKSAEEPTRGQLTKSVLKFGSPFVSPEHVKMRRFVITREDGNN